jgi:hypothetical protein
MTSPSRAPILCILAMICLLSACDSETRTPREIMASGLERGLADNALGKRVFPPESEDPIFGTPLATWSEPLMYKSDTRYDWTDGHQRIVTREKTQFWGLEDGTYEGIRSWTGKDFVHGARNRQVEVKWTSQGLFIKRENLEFERVEDLDDPHLRWRKTLTGAWETLASLAKSGIELRERGSTTRAGTVLARLTFEWKGSGLPAKLLSHGFDAIAPPEKWLANRMLTQVSGEVLVEPSTRRLWEGTLSFGLREKKTSMDRIRVTTRFELSPWNDAKEIREDSRVLPINMFDIIRDF